MASLPNVDMPVIGVGVNTTWNDTEYTVHSSPPFTDKAKYNSNGWTASLTQPLFRWQNWAAYKQGELAVAIAEAQFAAAQQDLIVRSAQEFAGGVLADDAALLAIRAL